jgi:hypothetical protein
MENHRPGTGFRCWHDRCLCKERKRQIETSIGASRIADRYVFEAQSHWLDFYKAQMIYERLE